MEADLEHELDIAEIKAWAALAEANYLMFGYWCDMWDYLNGLGGFQRPNPFKPLVDIARAVNDEKLRNNNVLQALAQGGKR